jgi:imidazolonepropionase-like amidohydrolase
MILAALLSAALAAPPTADDDAHVVLRAARLLDGTGGPAVENGVVVVKGSRIEAVGPADRVALPEGARTIDLGDATLLPGFIDCHTHLAGRVLGDPKGENAAVRDPEVLGAILGVAHCRKTLDAGFTTVRNVGASHFADVALRTAIAEGRIPGPRIVCAAHAIGITGGHGDENGFRAGLLDGDYRTGIADGVEECRKAVRYQIKGGADVIKMIATGGVLSEGDAVGATQYTLEEMKAIVDEAAKLERKVCAHAHGTEGIKLAVLAGVASIEHGSFLDDEGARLMAERGTYLVPTLMAGETVPKAAEAGILTGFRAEKARVAGKAMREAIRRAVAHGVPIALGTDSGVYEHGRNGREFRLLVEWGGMTPMDAIVAGTRNASRLLGLDDRIGTLETGKIADIVAVPGNPLVDIGTLERPSLVMKDGKIERHAPPTAE